MHIYLQSFRESIGPGRRRMGCAGDGARTRHVHAYVELLHLDRMSTWLLTPCRFSQGCQDHHRSPASGYGRWLAVQLIQILSLDLVGTRTRDVPQIGNFGLARSLQPTQILSL